MPSLVRPTASSSRPRTDRGSGSTIVDGYGGVNPYCSAIAQASSTCPRASSVSTRLHVADQYSGRPRPPPPASRGAPRRGGPPPPRRGARGRPARGGPPSRAPSCPGVAEADVGMGEREVAAAPAGRLVGAQG